MKKFQIISKVNSKKLSEKKQFDLWDKSDLQGKLPVWGKNININVNINSDDWYYCMCSTSVKESCFTEETEFSVPSSWCFAPDMELIEGEEYIVNDMKCILEDSWLREISYEKQFLTKIIKFMKKNGFESVKSFSLENSCFFNVLLKGKEGVFSAFLSQEKNGDFVFNIIGDDSYDISDIISVNFEEFIVYIEKEGIRRDDIFNVKCGNVNHHLYCSKNLRKVQSLVLDKLIVKEEDIMDFIKKIEFLVIFCDRNNIPIQVCIKEGCNLDVFSSIKLDTELKISVLELELAKSDHLLDKDNPREVINYLKYIRDSILLRIRYLEKPIKATLREIESLGLKKIKADRKGSDE